MAAPTKQGLDYFPHEIGLMKDRKLRPAKMKYGTVAADVYITLLELIYGDKGYYIEYGANRDSVVWDILEYLTGRFQPTADTVSDVIEELVACGLFSGDHYPEIITSKRVQQTYYAATVDRKAVFIEIDKWMLTKSEMLALSAKSSILSFLDNRPNNAVNRPINGVNRPNNRQSKVKESKVKESKVAMGDKPRIPPTLDEIAAYCKERGSSINPQRFYDYFTASNWVDSHGNKVKNWRQKVITWEGLACNNKQQSASGKYTAAEMDGILDRIEDIVI